MSDSELILDTDILSALMRKNPMVMEKAKTYLSVNRQFTISIITRYEILRGLKAKGAHKQSAIFERFCKLNRILPLSDRVIVRAADIYGDLHQRGQLISDADILIAATALEHGLDLATNNEKHFSRITGLNLENWLK